MALERRRSCTARKALLSPRCAMPPQLVRLVLLAMPISLFALSIVIMRLGMYAMPWVLQAQTNHRFLLLGSQYSSVLINRGGISSVLSVW